MAKSIGVIGTFDTKKAEGHYLKEQIAMFHHIPILVDVSLRKHAGQTVDISNEAIAEMAGTSIDEVSLKERGEAIELMTKGASKIVRELYEAKQIDGIIGYGGSVGLAITSSVMKPLPFGFPKVIVTTIAGVAGKYIEAKDIVIFPSITDLVGGERINRIEAITLANAAGAISGMVDAKPTLPPQKPLIVVSQFGVTTPHVQEAKKILENHGYEVVAFHAVGTGGQSLEELVKSGVAAGVLDVTTHEIADELVGGVCRAGPDRMESAGEKGIPQVILPGALDMVNFYEPETVPAKFHDRHFYIHNPKVTLMRTNADESAELGRIIARKINKAKGPTTVLIPEAGWSEYDKKAGVATVDYSGRKTNHPWYDPEADAAFTKSLKDHMDYSKTNIEVVVTEQHINDPKLAKLSTLILDDMINGKWKPRKKYS
jgi:uncharacterized protein (UPF0261 family)